MSGTTDVALSKETTEPLATGSLKTTQKIYFALMGNGSGDMMIRGVSLSAQGALYRLQEDFLARHKDDPDLKLEDPLAPTLDEMNFSQAMAYIIAVDGGTPLYEELRIDDCEFLKSDDERLVS